MLALLLFALPASGENLLLGSDPPPRRVPPVDSALPTGPLWESAEGPTSTLPLLCSFRYPLCVEVTNGDASWLALEVLDALETAYERTVLALRLPPPAFGLGPGVRAIVEDSTDLTAGVSVMPLPLGIRYFDSASALCQLGVRRGVALERAATLCIGEAIALGLDPGMNPHLRRAYATHLWWLVGHPTDEDFEGLAALQQSPGAAVFGGQRSPRSEGAAHIFEYLNHHFSRSASADVSTALLSRAGSHTERPATRWHNEPDVVDILRLSLEDTRDSWPKLLGDLARTRALLGLWDARSRPAGFFGDTSLVRAHFDWRIASSSLPRVVLTAYPVEPTGTTFVWIDVDTPFSEGDTLAMRAECEGPVSFAWEIVKLNGNVLEPSPIPTPYQERSTRTDRTITQLQNTRAVVIAGTNVGAISPAYPFDPDVMPYEPHACTIGLSRH